MKFTIKNKKARVVTVDPVAEVRGSEREVACEIKLEIAVSNDFLDSVAPSLKQLLYVKDKDSNDFISQYDPDHVTHLRFPMMVQPIKWDVAVEANVEIGIGAQAVVLDFARLQDMRTEALEGGMVLLSFKVHGYPTEKDFGALCKLLGCEVPVSISAAETLV